MSLLRNLGIKRKLTAITMLASGMALVAACIAFFTYEQVAARKRMARDLTTLADMIGAHIAAGFFFHEAGSVELTLQSLRAHPGITRACVYDKKGEPFARYQRGGNTSEFTPPPLQPDGHRFYRQHLGLYRKIDWAGEVVGTV